ncbi:hypothetical protein H4582DRAFT_1962185 [Lactarius indigo]|nr:hypothetical protein H4582DRAFT_1962185 [Lactarius indigo]
MEDVGIRKHGARDSCYRRNAPRPQSLESALTLAFLGAHFCALVGRSINFPQYPFCFRLENLLISLNKDYPMAHGRREHPKDDRSNGETNPRSTEASQYHPSENEHTEVPSQSMPPPAAPHYFGYAPWNAPPPHPGAQEPWYGVPGANGGVPGHGAWHEPPRHNYPPVPAMSAALRHTDQGAGGAGGAVPYHWDNGNPAGATCVYAPPLTSNSQPNGVAGPTPAANVHSVVGPGPDAQPYTPSIDAPVSSEPLMSLARSLILDPGTRVKVLNMEASGRGGLRVTITLETADTV